MQTNNLPAISIITVVYNAVSAIESTIMSVINLPYKNIEYIIVDGGSTDGTVDIIKKYETRIAYWTSGPDKGIYDAMNKGWNKASSNSYILFLGAGDKIIKLPGIISNSNPDIIYGNVQVDDERIFPASADIRLRLGNTIHHQALLIKKSIYPQPPFSLDYPIYADFDFNQRLLKEGRKFIKDKGFLSFAMKDGISKDFRRTEALQIVKKNYGSFWVAIAKLYYFFQKIYYPIRYKHH
ncbi:glycosyltransferase family 2 protein [Parafilimonas sp.]|uniref:glycosyltransferase family 2 protein n=1 Tax=Parafilimonas sp. TaxID=1969739 RepID=UPI003F7D29BD